MKALVLGAGPAQLDLIEYLSNQGLDIVVLSSRGSDHPIMKKAGFEITDIADVEGVAAAVSRHEPDFVYSIGSDLAMPTVAAVSERLGLPHFHGRQVAELFQNKAKMRQLLAGSEFSVAYQSGGTLESLSSWTRFPAILKPSDSQGQRGIALAHRFEDVVEGFDEARRASPTGQVILEEFLPGQEYSVNALLRRGVCEWLLPSVRISFSEYPGGIIKEHVFEAEPPLVGPSRRLIEELIAKTGVTDGPLYLQVKLDGSGRLKLVEAAARLDGCHLWRAIKMWSGFDILHDVLSQLQGLPVSRPPVVSQAAGVRLKFLTAPPGTMVDSALLSSMPSDALYADTYYFEGETVGRQNGHQEKVGYWIGRL